MINLKDITFIIPVFYDSDDRKENLEIIIKWIRKHFNTNIYIKEIGKNNHFKYLEKDLDYYDFCFQDHDIMHRTKMLNDLTKIVSTKYVSCYDTDVLLPVNKYAMCLEKLNNGIDFIFPYTYFYRIIRDNFINVFKETLDENILINFNQSYNHGSSYGGAYFYNKQSFINAGMENENYISYGGEDWERPIRFSNLGFKVERLDGILYHIDHFKGLNSERNHPFFQQNELEFEKVKKMSKEELQTYIKTWEWCNVNI